MNKFLSQLSIQKRFLNNFRKSNILFNFSSQNSNSGLSNHPSSHLNDKFSINRVKSQLLIPVVKIQKIYYKWIFVSFVIVLLYLYQSKLWNQQIIKQCSLVKNDAIKLEVKKRSYNTVILGRQISQCQKRSLF